MLRRITCVLVLFSLAVGLLSLKPVAAASASNDDNTAFADFFSADTIAYLNIQTTDLQNNINTLADLLRKTTGTQLPDPFQQIDAALTQLLGRKASFQTDVLPWLGDRVAVGFALPQSSTLSLMFSGNTQAVAQQLVIVASVKDSTAGDAFLKEVFAKVQQADPTFSTDKASHVQLGGEDATVYMGQMAGFIQGKSFYAVGLTAGINAMLSTAQDNKPTLNSVPGFTETMKLAQPNALANLYISPDLYKAVFQIFQAAQGLTPATQQAGQTNPMTAVQDLFSAIHGQVLSFQMTDKTLRLDAGQSYDAAKFKSAVQELYGDQSSDINLPALTAGWTDQIPSKALAVVTASGGLSSLYQTIRSAPGNMLSFGFPYSATGDQAKQSLDQFEAMMKSTFKLDVQSDIFNWMTGQFVVYMTYNPNSVLNTVTKSSTSTSGSGGLFPFDVTFIIKTGDTQKTADFISKLNTGLKSMGNNMTLSDAGNGFYTVADQQGGGISYGLSNDTFLVTSSSGLATATAALKGSDSLTANPAWKNAQKTAFDQAGQLLFVNLGELSTAEKANTSNDQAGAAQTQQILTALAPFESLAVYNWTGDNTNQTSIQLTLK